MTIKWLNAKKRPLMGQAFREVIGKGYWVKCTSYAYKADRKEVGRIFFVLCEQAQMEEIK